MPFPSKFRMLYLNKETMDLHLKKKIFGYNFCQITLLKLKIRVFVTSSDHPLLLMCGNYRCQCLRWKNHISKLGLKIKGGNASFITTSILWKDYLKWKKEYFIIFKLHFNKKEIQFDLFTMILNVCINLKWISLVIFPK